MDPDDLAETVRTKVVVDGRNCLDVDRWADAGWNVYCLGRGQVTASAAAPAVAPRS